MTITKFNLQSSFFTVTIARAIELKHNATLIAALAYETAIFYQKAGEDFLCDPYVNRVCF